MNADKMKKHHQTAEAISAAFRDGTFQNATPQQLVEWIACMSSDDFGRNVADAKLFVRTLAINHVQMARVVQNLEETIRELNRRNDVISQRMLIFTIVCATGTLAQVIIALCR